MKYRVYRTTGPFGKPDIFFIEADTFIARKNHIIFKKGFRSVSFFQSDLVDYILVQTDLDEYILKGGVTK